jgi:hypothetical protein
MLLLCLETRHCRLVRVDDSTKVELVTVDLIGAVFGCGGYPFQLGFGFIGAQIELGF